MDVYLLALALAATCAAGLHYAGVSRWRHLGSLEDLFLLGQWVMLVGTIPIVDSGNSVHVRYVEILTYSVFAFAATSLLLTEHRKAPFARTAQPRVVHPVGLTPLVIPALLFSLAVTIWYFNAVGHSALLEGLRALHRGVETDVTTLRLMAYSGDRYFAPGYVNQFKNVMLPALSLVVAYTLFSVRSPFRWPVTLGLALVCTAALVATGQRMQFIQFALVVVVFLSLKSRRVNWKILLSVGLASLPVLMVVTLVLGRSAALEEAAGLFSYSSILLSNLFERFFVSNQLTGLVAFTYTFSLPTQWGADWGDALWAVLPGSSRTSTPLSSEVFYVLYNTRRGTAPPSLIGSVHYNFGLVGVLTAPFVLAYFAHRVMERVQTTLQTDALELVGMAGVIVVFATWLAGDPTYLLNNGIVVYAAMWVIGRRMRRAVPLVAPLNKTTRRSPPGTARHGVDLP